MKKHRTEIKWQSAIFGIYFIISLLQAYSEHPASGIYLSELFDVSMVILSECVLLNIIANWLMIKHPYSQSPIKYLSILFVIFFVFLIFKYLTVFPGKIDIMNTYKGIQNEQTLSFFLFYSTINVIITTLVAFGLYSIKRSFRVEHRSKLLEKEINEAKLTILKNQINPHFLYNTLSYMYSQASIVSPNLAKSILLLSDMMRYSVSKTDDKGLTLLEDEINYIINFIEIHRLRFDKDFYLDLELEGIFGNKKIVPLLLISFVENAIKHGKINDINNPILIKISQNENVLLLLAKNLKQIGSKDKSSGIGLVNTKNRLNLVYPNKHHLEIIDKPDYFEVNLKIEMNGD